MNKCEQSVGRLAECLETLNQSLMEMAAVFRVKRQVLAKADMRALGELFEREEKVAEGLFRACLLYTSPSPRDRTRSRMPSSA